MTPPPSLRSRVPALSEAVEQVILRALAKDPADRFPSIQSFATALHQATQASEPSPIRGEEETVLPQSSSISQPPSSQQVTVLEDTSLTQGSPTLNTPVVSSLQGGSPLQTGLNVSPALPSQRRNGTDTGRVWAKAVWERIKQKDVPSTWHILQGTYTASNYFVGILGGFIAFGFASLVVDEYYGSITSDAIPGWVGTVVIALVAIGFWLGAEGSQERTLFVLMPEGFISFSGENPRHIISYNAVEAIRFDHTTKHLVVITPWSGSPENDSPNDDWRVGRYSQLQRSSSSHCATCGTCAYHL